MTFLTFSLIGCGQTKIIEKPVPVEVIKTERVGVPEDLLIRHQKTTVPETLTFGDAMQLWVEDRAMVDKLNGQITAIQSLSPVE